MNLTPLMSSEGGYDFLLAEDGMGIFQPLLERKDFESQIKGVQTNSVAFAFETGEVWSVDTRVLGYDELLPLCLCVLLFRLLIYQQCVECRIEQDVDPWD